ncbi:MAG TPA: ArsR family transcriptional regulator [candidate division Zixibacteria bacterium]|nr:ArsR family transcriptional regulator [candidate division Zixibacteria bacterium]
MSDFSKVEILLKAFASTSRLEIIDCIQKGITKPGEIALKLNKHRSTIDKHLKILVEADVVKRVVNPIIEDTTISYVLHKNANVLLATIKHLLNQ